MSAELAEHCCLDSQREALVCKHCGGAEPVKLPVLVEEVLAAAVAFSRVHRDCKPGSSTQPAAATEKADGTLSGPGWSGSFGGQCPVQGHGTVDGWPFYFRARGEHWSLSVAPPGGDAVAVACGEQQGWELVRPYGCEAFDASYMPLDEVVRAMLGAVECFRAWRAAYERGEAGFPVTGAQEVGS